MFRKLCTLAFTLGLVGSLSAPSTAYSSQGYVKLYNYTETPVTVWVDGTNWGDIEAGNAPTWIPTCYGLHKVEVNRCGEWRTAYKYCEVSYSYPNATVEIGRYDL